MSDNSNTWGRVLPWYVGRANTTWGRVGFSIVAAIGNGIYLSIMAAMVALTLKAVL